MRNIENLNPGDSVDHFFLVHKATQGVTAQGKDYMTLHLQDKVVKLKRNFGRLQKMIWQQSSLKKLYMLKVTSVNYRGNKQMKVNQIRLATTEDQLKTEQFVDGAPLSPAEIQEEISHYLLVY